MSELYRDSFDSAHNRLSDKKFSQIFNTQNKCIHHGLRFLVFRYIIDAIVFCALSNGISLKEIFLACNLTYIKAF